MHQTMSLYSFVIVLKVYDRQVDQVMEIKWW